MKPRPCFVLAAVTVLLATFVPSLVVANQATIQASPTCDGIDFQFNGIDPTIVDIDISRQTTTDLTEDGSGAWIGVYPAVDSFLDSLPGLPPHSSRLLKAWSYVCGSRSWCDFSWPTHGELLFPTSTIREVLEENVEYVAVAAVGFQSMAVSEKFTIRSQESCRVGGNDPMFGYVQEVRKALEELILENTERIGQFLRLVFHDCVGGCDGCIDLTNPDNNGLLGPIDDLHSIVHKYGGDNLTRTDIWMLSGLVATEIALPGNADTNVLDFGLQWRGRKTCEDVGRIEGNCGLNFHGNQTVCTAWRGPHRDLCHGVSGTKTVQEFFENEFGSLFDYQQITALMGAHSLGRMRRNNSGSEGSWDSSPDTLDVGYFLELADGTAPDYELVAMDNSDLDGIADTMQWEGILRKGSVVMLNADMALVRNVTDVEKVDCTFIEGLEKSCGGETPFREHVEIYANDRDQFLVDFQEVFNLLIDHGHEGVKSACPHDEICVFPEVSHYPSSSPSASPTSTPSASPSAAPSPAPSNAPTASPSAAPSSAPSISPMPSFRPSMRPTNRPTSHPTLPITTLTSIGNQTTSIGNQTTSIGNQTTSIGNQTTSIGNQTMSNQTANTTEPMP